MTILQAEHLSCISSPLRQPRKICYAAYSATKIVKNFYISFKIANFAFNIKI
jgi:hypothetical protein